MSCVLAEECREADTRLIDRKTPYSGRVEICLNGVWGSICSNSWDNTNATVVCQQLGYIGG